MTSTMDREQLEGYRAGRTWAAESATPSELSEVRGLGALDWVYWYVVATDGWPTLTEALSDHFVGRDWTTAQLITPDAWILGFVAGAAAVACAAA